MSDKSSLKKVLDPEICVVGGCSFRVNPFSGCKLGLWVEGEDFSQDVESDKLVCAEPETPKAPFSSKICATDDGYTLTLFNFDRFVFRNMKLLYHDDLKQLCRDHDVSFIMTPVTSAEPSIILNNTKQQNIYQAEKTLSMFMKHLKINTKSTHFLSIPVDLEEEQRDFVKKVGDELPMYCNHESYFINPKLLHLTITTLCLFSETDVTQFKECFNIVCAKHARACFQEGPLIVRVSGLASMQTDLTEAVVVYAKIEEPGNTNRLQSLFNNIVADLRTFGYIKPSVEENVLIHMTIMKSPKVKKSKARPTFNATYLLNKFRDYVFGPVLLKSIHFSVLTEIDADTGYYKDLCNVDLN